MQTDGQTWRTVAFRTFAGAPKKDKNFNKLNIWDMCFLIHNIPGTIMELIPAVCQTFCIQIVFLSNLWKRVFFGRLIGHDLV